MNGRIKIEIENVPHKTEKLVQLAHKCAGLCVARRSAHGTYADE